MPEKKVYAESYFGDKMVNAVTAILDCSRDELVMELYNMLVTPHYDWSLRWHRDDIGPEVEPEEELRRLQEPMLHAQWNLALYADQSLIVVPGSHKRSRTPMERGADPYEDDMPGQLAVKLCPGDIVFYNNNLLHRGVYDSRTERMTRKYYKFAPRWKHTPDYAFSAWHYGNERSRPSSREEHTSAWHRQVGRSMRLQRSVSRDCKACRRNEAPSAGDGLGRRRRLLTTRCLTNVTHVA